MVDGVIVWQIPGFGFGFGATTRFLLTWKCQLRTSCAILEKNSPESFVGMKLLFTSSLYFAPEPSYFAPECNFASLWITEKWMN